MTQTELIEKWKNLSGFKKFLVILAVLWCIGVIIGPQKHSSSNSYSSSSTTENSTDDCGGNNVNFNAGFESGSQDGAYMMPCENSPGYGMTTERDCYCKGYKAGQIVSSAKADAK